MFIQQIIFVVKEFRLPSKYTINIHTIDDFVAAKQRILQIV